MSSLLEPGTSFADYVIDAVIGRGGMSVVYRARELHPDRVVALKLMDPDLALDESFRTRFLRESDLAASIGHPNIVPIFDAGEADGQLFIAMPLIEGSDLGVLLRREGSLALGRATAIVDQVGRALDAGHAKGLVHRDVKPANVLLVPPSAPGDPEYVYLADFGLARRTATSLKLTQHATFLGTREYAAPEQIRGEDVDGRADIYALGCVLYECLAGAPPFEAESESALIYAHLERDPPPITERRGDLPRAVDQVIARAMAKNRDDRYATCRELTAELTERAPPAGATEIDTAGARSAPTEYDRAKGATQLEPTPSRRRALPFVLAGLALLAIGGLIALLAGGGGGGGSKSSSNAAATPTGTAAPAATPPNGTLTSADPQVQQYRAAVAAIGRRLNATGNKLPSGRQFGTPAFKSAVLTVVDETNSIATDLGALQPPAQVTSQHAAVLRQLQVLEDYYRALVQASDSHDLNAASSSLSRISAALTRINQAADRIIRRL